MNLNSSSINFVDNNRQNFIDQEKASYQGFFLKIFLILLLGLVIPLVYIRFFQPQMWTEMRFIFDPYQSPLNRKIVNNFLLATTSLNEKEIFAAALADLPVSALYLSWAFPACMILCGLFLLLDLIKLAVTNFSRNLTLIKVRQNQVFSTITISLFLFYVYLVVGFSI